MIIAASAENTARYTTDRRKTVVRKSLSVVTDHVSGAADRVQERPVEALVNLGPQTRDVHVNDVGLRIEVIVPDIFEQNRARDDMARMAHQIFEEAEFAQMQRDGLARARDAVRQAVEGQVADAQHR